MLSVFSPEKVNMPTLAILSYVNIGIGVSSRQNNTQVPWFEAPKRLQNQISCIYAS